MEMLKKFLLGRGRRVPFAMLAVLCLFGSMACNTAVMGGSEDLDGLGGGSDSISLILINNCAGLPLKVTVNADGVWMSGGSTQCGAGDTCTVAPGTYPLDLGSSGLDFFVGDSEDNATKAEVTYLDVLTYDISVISTTGCSDSSCTSTSCCNNQFNQGLKITTDPVCRCVYCNSVDCPDAYHWPHDDVKQIRCDPTSGIQSLTIEFCPASACPSTGFANCTAPQQAICFNPSDQPCTGDKAICCPQSSFGASHVCYCETAEAFCATAPDPGSGCGSDTANYCYVAFPPPD
jgi:hypothetical protein